MVGRLADKCGLTVPWGWCPLNAKAGMGLNYHLPFCPHPCAKVAKDERDAHSGSQR